MSGLNFDKISETAFDAKLQSYVGLLKRTRALETELSTVPVQSQETLAKHRTIYNILIKMAPHYQVRNPQLQSQLKERRQKLPIH